LKYGAQILTENYKTAFAKYRNEDQALDAALSAYNTGDFENGITNGYVNKVIDQAAYQVPAIKLGRTPVVGASSDTKSRRLATSTKTRQSVQPRSDKLLAAKFARMEVESY